MDQEQQRLYGVSPKGRESLNAGIVTEWTYNVAGNEMNANRAACIGKSNAPGVGVGAGVGKKEIIAF